MRLASPQLLWLAPVAVVLLPLVWLLLERSRNRRLRSLLSTAMISRLVPSRSMSALLARRGLILLAALALVVAAARPQWGDSSGVLRKSGVDVVFVLDTSLSMSAGEGESRLGAARRVIDDLLDALAGDRVGLVAFAGEAQVLCPLTLDRAAFRMLLWSADEHLLPTPGSDLGRGLTRASSLFQDGERRYRVIVLVSDGEDHELGALTAATDAHTDGALVHVIGVGAIEQEPMPVRDDTGEVTGYKLDPAGQPILTRLEVETLRAVATAGGGVYVPATAGARAIALVASEVAGMERREIEGAGSTQLEDRLEIPMLVAFICLALEALISLGAVGRTAEVLQSRSELDTRTRVGAVVGLLLLGMSVASPADADGVVDALAARARDVRGLVEHGLAGSDARVGFEAYESSEFERAVTHFRRAVEKAPGAAALRYDLGTSLLGAGRLEEAIEVFETLLAATPDIGLATRTEYNLAQARHLNGEPDLALAAYRRTLILDPSDVDAKHNFEVVLGELEQDQEEPSPSPSPSPEPSPSPSPPAGAEPSPTPSPGEGEPPPPSPSPHSSSSTPPSAPSLSREDAERLLDAVAEQEGTSSRRRVDSPAGARKLRKDW